MFCSAVPALPKLRAPSSEHNAGAPAQRPSLSSAPFDGRDPVGGHPSRCLFLNGNNRSCEAKLLGASALSAGPSQLPLRDLRHGRSTRVRLAETRVVARSALLLQHQCQAAGRPSGDLAMVTSATVPALQPFRNALKQFRYARLLSRAEPPVQPCAASRDSSPPMRGWSPQPNMTGRISLPPRPAAVTGLSQEGGFLARIVPYTYPGSSLLS